MLSFARFVGLCLVAAVLALQSFPSAVQAQRSLECQKVWTRPSSDNDIVDCVKDLDRIKAEWIYYIGPAVALVLFLSLMTWCTCLYCGCYCKCCCTCITHKPTMAKRHYKLRKSCLITLILIPASLCIMVFFVVGAIYLHEIVSKGVNQMSSGPLAFFNETKDEMTVLMTDHNYDPPKVTVNFDEFNDLFDTITTEVSSVKDFMNKTIIPTIAVGASLGALVFILVVAAMIVTRCYCCLWCGGMCGWVYYLLAVIYSIFAFALAIGFYAVATVCGEIRLQYKRYPGIFQWYFVPRIEEEVDFKTLRKDIANETAQSSMDACADLINICEASTGVNDDKPFVCPDGFTSSDQCLNYYDVSDVVDNTVMKPSLIPTLCPAPGGSSSGWTCTIEECSTSCNDESVKDTAMKVISTMDFAANATEALALADPLIQTDYIVDLVLSVIESKANSPLAGYHHGNVYRCTELRLISLMFAVSFFIGALILLVALCVLLSAYQAYKATPKEEKDSKEDKKKKKDLPPTLTAEDDVDMDSLNEPKDLYSRSEDSEGMNERALALGEEQPGEPLSLGADHYGIPAEFYQDDAVDEEEMLNRARQTSNRRLPLNPLAR